MPSLLAFIPHPDDEAYAFGGLIALASRAGWMCHIECATYGEHGERHDAGPLNPNALADTRAAELEASCRILGAGLPEFWGLPDGELRLHRGERSRIVSRIRALEPSLILSLGPDGAYGHPDHLALYRWVTEAWQSLDNSRPPLLYAAFLQGLFLPQYEKCLPMLGDPPTPAPESIGAHPWHYTVPIAEVTETKRAAIAAHRSQLPNGDPEALFPPRIVAALMSDEHYADASGAPSESTLAVVASMSRS